MIAEPAWLTFLIDLVTDESKHFALSAFTGALGCLLMQIILFVMVLGWQGLTRQKASMGVVYGMGLSCLLVGLSFALASHWALDYASAWYVTPLGPPLDLVMP